MWPQLKLVNTSSLQFLTQYHLMHPFVLNFRTNDWYNGAYFRQQSWPLIHHLSVLYLSSSYEFVNSFNFWLGGQPLGSWFMSCAFFLFWTIWTRPRCFVELWQPCFVWRWIMQGILSHVWNFINTFFIPNFCPDHTD